MKKDLRKNSAEKPKTSKLAIASLILAILSFLLFILTGLPAIVLATGALVKILSSRGKLKGIGLSLAAIIIAWVACMAVAQAAFFLWGLDAPPIPNDYTIADLRSAPPDCAKSYELLRTLLGTELEPQGISTTGLSEENVKNIDQITAPLTEGRPSEIAEALNNDKHKILQAWTNAQQTRRILGNLNTFDEIADPTKPTFSAEILYFRPFVNLARLYQAYIFMQIQQHDGKPSINQLIEFDSAIRKFSPNARTLVAKLACCLCLTINITTANAILNSPDITQENLELLAEHFAPLTTEHTSLRNSVLTEYLSLKEMLTCEQGNRFLGTNPCLKTNSTLRLYKNLCDGWITTIQGHEKSNAPQLSVWPFKFLDHCPVSIDPQGQVPWYYKCYNLLGSIFVRGMRPNFETFVAKIERIRVQDEMLQIVLNKRLGKEVSLKARAYSDEYIIDVENKIIFSPGPDGEPHTEDDIKLPINPEVLGFED